MDDDEIWDRGGRPVEQRLPSLREQRLIRKAQNPDRRKVEREEARDDLRREFDWTKTAVSKLKPQPAFREEKDENDSVE